MNKIHKKFKKNTIHMLLLFIVPAVIVIALSPLAFRYYTIQRCHYYINQITENGDSIIPAEIKNEYYKTNLLPAEDWKIYCSINLNILAINDQLDPDQEDHTLSEEEFRIVCNEFLDNLRKLENISELSFLDELCRSQNPYLFNLASSWQAATYLLNDFIQSGRRKDSFTLICGMTKLYKLFENCLDNDINLFFTKKIAVEKLAVIVTRALSAFDYSGAEIAKLHKIVFSLSYDSPEKIAAQLKFNRANWYEMYKPAPMHHFSSIKLSENEKFNFLLKNF